MWHTKIRKKNQETNKPQKRDQIFEFQLLRNLISPDNSAERVTRGIRGAEVDGASRFSNYTDLREASSGSFRTFQLSGPKKDAAAAAAGAGREEGGREDAFRRSHLSEWRPI